MRGEASTGEVRAEGAGRSACGRPLDREVIRETDYNSPLLHQQEHSGDESLASFELTAMNHVLGEVRCLGGTSNCNNLAVKTYRNSYVPGKQ